MISIRLRTGKLLDDDWPRLQLAVNMLSEAKLFIDDTPALSPGEVRARAARCAREHGNLGLIVIDYLQLMKFQGFKENRTAGNFRNFSFIKIIGKRIKCACYCFVTVKPKFGSTNG